MKTHFLQSPAWEKFEQSEGKATFRIRGADFEAMAVLNTTPLGKYLFCPYGPAVANLDGLQNALGALRDLAREQNCFFVRIEPTLPFSANEMRKLGLKKSHDLEPAHTWMLDLTQPEEQIFAEIEKEKMRIWRNYHKKNITLRKTQNPDEIGILVKLLAKVGEQDGFIPQDEAHLRRQMETGFATLYIAELEGEPIAAALAHDDGTTRAYAHAAADFAHRKLRAGTILLVQMIADAKNAGAEKFDFWGITTSENPKHPWYGFTQYKKSFGGAQVDYAGTWDLPIGRAKYWAYGIIRRLNRWKRKITRKN